MYYLSKSYVVCKESELTTSWSAYLSEKYLHLFFLCFAFFDSDCRMKLRNFAGEFI